MTKRALATLSVSFWTGTGTPFPSMESLVSGQRGMHPPSHQPPRSHPSLIEGSKTQSSNAAPSMLASTTNLLSLIDSDKPASPAPGASQSKPAAASGASTAPFNAVISIGCLLKGSTMHFEYICDAVSQGLMRVGLDTGTPVIFGVLTCLTEDQALERAGVGRKGNKGHSEYMFTFAGTVADGGEASGASELVGQRR